MADKKISVSILGKLNQGATKKNINEQLKQIGKETTIKFGVDQKDLEKAKAKIAKDLKVISDAEKQNAQASKAVVKSINDQVLSVKTLKDAQGKSIEQQIKYRTEANKTETVVVDLVKNQVKYSTELNKSGESAERASKAYSDMYEKALRMNNTFDTNAEKRKQEEIYKTKKALNEFQTAQYNANNLSNKSAKVSASVIKAELDRRDAFERTGKELKELGKDFEATTFKIKKFSGENFHKSADDLNNSFRKLNVTENMTQKEMSETVSEAKRLKRELNNVQKEATSTGNSGLKLGQMFKTAIPKFIA